jgi:hypothetical protein
MNASSLREEAREDFEIVDGAGNEEMDCRRRDAGFFPRPRFLAGKADVEGVGESESDNGESMVGLPSLLRWDSGEGVSTGLNIILLSSTSAFPSSRSR